MTTADIRNNHYKYDGRCLLWIGSKEFRGIGFLHVNPQKDSGRSVCKTNNPDKFFKES